MRDVWYCDGNNTRTNHSSYFIGCVHDPANVQHYMCWKLAGRLLDRVNTPLHFDSVILLRYLSFTLSMFYLSAYRILRFSLLTWLAGQSDFHDAYLPSDTIGYVCLHNIAGMN